MRAFADSGGYRGAYITPGNYYEFGGKTWVLAEDFRRLRAEVEEKQKTIDLLLEKMTQAVTMLAENERERRRNTEEQR